MTVIIIPYGNEGKYTKIVGAENLDVTLPPSAVENIFSIGGDGEYFVLEDVDDWDGNLDELREKADEITLINADGTKRYFRRETLIDKIKERRPFGKK